MNRFRQCLVSEKEIDYRTRSKLEKLILRKHPLNQPAEASCAHSNELASCLVVTSLYYKY